MGKKIKDINYEIAKRYIKDKDTAINYFIESSLDKTQQIFRYENLPETLPQEQLERLLQENGHCIIVEEKGGIWALTGGFSGEPDPYNNPTQYTVSNVALGLTKTYDLLDECVLVKNDFKMLGMLPILQKYGVLLTDSELSLNTATILSRITMLISAPDDKTKASAELFIQKIIDGDFTVIGENGFFDGVKMQTATTTNSNYITQLIELIQYYKASFLNEIGLNANYNMKRERLTAEEVALNIDNLLPFIENMYDERVKAVKKINEMFGLNIVVDYNGVWKTTQEHAQKEELFTEVETIEEVENEIATDFMNEPETRENVENVDNLVDNMDDYTEIEESEVEENAESKRDTDK